MMQVFPFMVLVPKDSAALKILSLQRRAFFENSRISASLFPVVTGELFEMTIALRLSHQELA